MKILLKMKFNTNYVNNNFRNQRDQLILASEMQQNLPIFQIGPEPSKLILDENDLASQNKVELDKLRVQVDKYRDELQYKNVELEKINDKNKLLVYTTLIH